MPESLHLIPRDAAGTAGPSSNHLLRLLPPETMARIAPELERVELRTRAVLWEADAPIRSVYFPHTSVISLIVPLQGSGPVEASTVGREGFVGVPILLGGDSASTRAITQIEGTASRLPASVFRRLVAEDGALQQLSLRYVQALLEQTSQAVACNGRHDLSERCARWLLMTRDRLDTDEFHLTQDFLAAMLGVRRATVTVAAGMLQRAGLIKYQRGRVRILDRARLEEAACECYGVVRRKFDQLLGHAG
jgi:CRP-like cAMP-binding protein